MSHIRVAMEALQMNRDVKRALEALQMSCDMGRGIGKTKAIAEAALKIGATVVCANEAQAKQIRETYGVATTTAERMYAICGPFLWDHFALERVAVNALRELRGLCIVEVSDTIEKQKERIAQLEKEREEQEKVAFARGNSVPLWLHNEMKKELSEARELAREAMCARANAQRPFETLQEHAAKNNKPVSIDYHAYPLARNALIAKQNKILRDVIKGFGGKDGYDSVNEAIAECERIDQVLELLK